MSVSVTLNFPDAASAAAALQRLSCIDYVDRPDVGTTVTVSDAAPAAAPEPEFNPFAAAAAVVPPPPVQLPLPAVPSVPSVPAGVAVAAPGPTVDSTGLPWDARIHAGNKATNKDGTWRAKKGLNDEAAVKAIEASLRAAVGAPPAPAPAASSPAGAVALAVPSIASVAPPAPATIAPPPAVPAPPATIAPSLAAPAAPAGSLTFGEFMAQMAPLFAADQAGNTARMGQALAVVGLSQVGQLAARPDLIPTVKATFDALLAQPA